MAAQGKPWIRFEATGIPDRDVIVHCEQGHESFHLILRVRLGGASVSRHAECVQCGETQPID